MNVPSYSRGPDYYEWLVKMDLLQKKVKDNGGDYDRRYTEHRKKGVTTKFYDISNKEAWIKAIKELPAPYHVIFDFNRGLTHIRIYSYTG